MTINLVETKTKLFFNYRLKDISDKNFKKKSTIVNIIIFLLFLLSVYFFLNYKKKNRPDNKPIDDIKMRKFLLNKMTRFNKNEIKTNLITNLPVYSNDYNPRIL